MIGFRRRTSQRLGVTLDEAMNLAGNRVLVTGGWGMIGSHVIEAIFRLEKEEYLPKKEYLRIK